MSEPPTMTIEVTVRYVIRGPVPEVIVTSTATGPSLPMDAPEDLFAFAAAGAGLHAYVTAAGDAANGLQAATRPTQDWG